MSTRLLASITSIAALTASVVCAAPAARAETIRLLSIPTGHSSIVPVEGVSRIAIGDDKIAGVVPLKANELIVNGKKAGRTTLVVWDARGRRDNYDVVVTDQRSDQVAPVLRQTLDEPNVTVTELNGSIVVGGTVADNARFARVQNLISRFDLLAKNDGYVIVNAVSVRAPFGDVQLGDIPRAHDLRLEPDAKGNVVVSGRVDDRVTAEAVLDRARGLAGSLLAADGKVIDRLGVDQVSQVNVKVYILEVDNTGLSQLGLRLQGATPDPNQPNTLIFGDPTFVAAEGGGANAAGKALTLAPFFRLTRLAPTLDAILRTGHARILSEPDLVTSPGQKASFLVGGEVPYAYSTGLGQVSIVFKEYGVKLQLTPTILGSGAIETNVAPEVSELDYQNGIQLNGFVVPALKTSRIATDLVTKPGESIVMGGLMQRIEQKTIDKIPLLGDIPVLGKLFRSTRYQTQQTDVVFVMTPEIITR